MPTPSSDELKQLLRAWSDGDQAALENLIALVDRELRMMARALLRRKRCGPELEITDLINETFLRFTEMPRVDWQSREHFLWDAHRIMWRILIEYQKEEHKRTRVADHISLMNVASVSGEKNEKLLLLDEALDRLAALDELKSRVVELTWFDGLSTEETAGLLGVSSNTIKREWQLAKAWLRRELGE